MSIRELNPALPPSWLQLGHLPLKLFLLLPARRALSFCPQVPWYRRPCSTTLTSPALSLLPAWIASWHPMSAITPCPARLPARSGRTSQGRGNWCWESWQSSPRLKNQWFRELLVRATRFAGCACVHFGWCVVNMCCILPMRDGGGL